MEATNQALTVFDKSKTGGKLRSDLMKKRNACKVVISADDRVKHHKWMEQRVKLEKERDEKMEKKKALSGKLEANTRAKRLDGKGWFIPMDRIYAKYGVKREDYHKRKFSG